MTAQQETFYSFSYELIGDDIRIAQPCGGEGDEIVQLHRSQLAYVCEKAGLIGGTEEQADRVAQLERRLIWMADKLEMVTSALPPEPCLMETAPEVEPFFLWHHLLLDSVSEMLQQLGIDWTPLEESDDEDEGRQAPAPAQPHNPASLICTHAATPTPQQSLFDAKEQAHE